MKKIIITAILVTSSFASSSAFSEIFKCTIGTSVTYQSAPCPEKTKDTNDGPSAFDGWSYGLHFSEAKRQAKRKKIALTAGLNAYLSTYNAKHLASNKNAREYSYRTKIMEKTAVVTLFFTKTTMELYKISARLYVGQLKAEERKFFYEALYGELSKKYGKSKVIKTDAAKKQNLIGSLMLSHMNGSLQAWGTDTENLVTLNYKKNYQSMQSYTLTYQNLPLVEQNRKEITYSIKQRTKKAMIEDAGKL